MKVPEPRKLPSGNWFIHLRLGGQNIPVTAPTKKECIQTATLAKAEYLAGKRVQKKRETVTLGHALDEYISRRENVLSPSTVIGYKDIRRNRFQSCMDQPLDKIDWQRAVNDEGKSHKTVKNALGLMRSVYKDKGLPFPDVRLPAAAKTERPWLTSEEITKFVDLVRGKPCEIPALLALHSLRKSEVCGLEWSDVDLQAGTIRVNGALILTESGEWVKRKQNKTLSSTRTVPLFIPALAEALAAVEDKTGRVVKVHPETPYRQIQAICKANGLPLVGWHGLRHSFASLCYSQGVNELTCMQLGGWSDFGTMRKIYTHIAEADRVKAVESLSGFFAPSKETPEP